MIIEIEGERWIIPEEPFTTTEKYLAYLCGVYKGKLPHPYTRIDQYLNVLCILKAAETSAKIEREAEPGGSS